jgi:hypothetical protein
LASTGRFESTRHATRVAPDTSNDRQHRIVSEPEIQQNDSPANQPIGPWARSSFWSK